MIGIYAALHSVFCDQQRANGWIRRPNQAALFGGEAALALMCSGRVEAWLQSVSTARAKVSVTLGGRAATAP
ncbi:DUF2384 domain-containing protein [Stenotrophomonas maltophilia]|nr:DUF2384 domain-containing protein [Stenotrophomonas maltophilia]